MSYEGEWMREGTGGDAGERGGEGREGGTYHLDLENTSKVSIHAIRHGRLSIRSIR